MNPPSAAAALRVENLGKHYADVPVFANVSFSVEPGEFVAIVGDSGVGKSTLLNCLAGLDTWYTGRVVHGSTDLGPLDDTARALWRRAHVGFVFQAFHVLPHLTVHDNVALPRATRAAPVKEGPEPGPIYLQDHGNPVRLRNIWVLERQG